MSHCILLNADYSFLGLVNWKRAFCLLTKGKVEVVKDSRATILSAAGKVFRVPAVLRVIKLIRTIYRAGVREQIKLFIERNKWITFIEVSVAIFVALAIEFGWITQFIILAVILYAWLSLWLRGKGWSDFGLKKPESWKKTIFLALLVELFFRH